MVVVGRSFTVAKGFVPLKEEGEDGCKQTTEFFHLLSTFPVPFSFHMWNFLLSAVNAAKHKPHQSKEHLQKLEGRNTNAPQKIITK